MFLDGVSALALVYMGATVSVISVKFKLLLGCKVTFECDQTSTYCGTSSASLCPLGICSMKVALGDTVFQAELIFLPRSTHDIILGIDFLKTCGTTVDCQGPEVYFQWYPCPESHGEYT